MCARRCVVISRTGINRTMDRIMRKKPVNLTAVIYPDADSDWLVAHNPETGTTTQGKTFEETLANLKEATELYLSEFPLTAKGRAIFTTFDIAESQTSHA